MGAPAWWNTRRFGLLVHANLASVPAWAPVGQYAGWYRAHTDGHVPDVLLHPSPLVETLVHHRDRWGHIDHYDEFLPFLTFDDFDPDAWTALARDAGMSYLVAVAKHHDGMCWWDAPGTDRTVLHDGPRRNVIGDLAAACERAGLPLGTYYSLLDWADVRYPGADYVDQAVHPQVLDLVERYGSRMLWGDGHWGAGGGHWRSDELVAAARRIEPELVVNDRWWSEGPVVRSFEYRVPDSITTEPWELRRGLGASLGLNRAEGADHLLDAGGIVGLLTEVVAKGGHLLLSVGADAAGRVPALHAERIRAAGGWIRRHQELVDRGVPWGAGGTWGDDEARYLVLDGMLHAIDVGGHGRFTAVARRVGRAASVETADGTSVPFDQDDDGLRLHRPSRRPQRLPVAYRIALEPLPEPPVELFPPTARQPIELAALLRDARPGAIVQLGEGDHVGPARIPDGVTVRGLGPDRTRIDGRDSCAVALGSGSRLEHCAVLGAAPRIVWLPRQAVRIGGDAAVLLGCRVDGHVEVAGADHRIVSCIGAGVVGRDVERLQISRSTFRGMNWDCAIDVEGGAGHVIDSCEFSQLLVAIRLAGTVGAAIGRNRITARWCGVQLVDTDGSRVVGNAFERTMRAIDVDGGALALITGNAALGGDSGCVLQRGAADCEVSGNHWERCRIGLLAWDAGQLRHRDNACVDLGEPDAAITIGP